MPMGSWNEGRPADAEQRIAADQLVWCDEGVGAKAGWNAAGQERRVAGGRAHVSPGAAEVVEQAVERAPRRARHRLRECVERARGGRRPRAVHRIAAPAYRFVSGSDDYAAASV